MPRRAGLCHIQTESPTVTQVYLLHIHWTQTLHNLLVGTGPSTGMLGSLSYTVSAGQAEHAK